MRFAVAAATVAALLLGGCGHDDEDDPDPPPVLAARIDTPAGDVTLVAGGAVSFSGTVSNGSAPYAHLWTFGAGGPADAVVEDPGSVAFPTPGIYVVTYQVTDAKGRQRTDTVIVTVQVIVATISSPTADVTIDEGDAVNFQATVSGGTPAFTHAWDFSGGAAASTVEDPGNVTFSTAGVYVVTYTVTDSLAQSDFDTVTVTVVVASGAPYTKAQVKNKWALLQPVHGAFSYSTVPVEAVNDTGFEGVISQQMITDGINLVNFYRWLAGLPDTVVENVGQRVNCQKGSHVLVMLAEQGAPVPDPHNPPPPAGASANYLANIYTPGEAACGQSNIFRGFGPAPFKPDQSVHGYMDDFGNAGTLGHRRWILHPRLNSTTFGAVNATSGAPNNNWASLMHVFDTSAPAPTFDFAAYPSEGYYPKQLFLDPVDAERVLWSFSANSALYNLNVASVSVTRRSDGAVLPVTTALLPNGYGISPTIRFNPNQSTLNETYDVTVSNITVLAGGFTSYSYWVQFFDINAP